VNNLLNKDMVFVHIPDCLVNLRVRIYQRNSYLLIIFHKLKGVLVLSTFHTNKYYRFKFITFNNRYTFKM